MIRKNNAKRVCFSVTNCICYDQRVLKIAGSVAGLGCDITIVGRRTEGCCHTLEVPFRTRRLRIPFSKGFLFYSFFQVRLFLFLLFNRFELLVANDLDTLLPGYLISAMRGIPLVYDSHEYFTGVPELRDRPFVRGVWKRVERFVFPKLKYVMTVSEGIAGLYSSEYGKKPVTVLNCSPFAGNILPFTRSELETGEQDLLVILQGTGINARRGGEELVEAVSLTPGLKLLVVGSGSSLVEMKRIASAYNATGRIKFIERLPWEQMMRYTRSADIGVTLDRGDDVNSLYSLPNKLFDYISAGIAVLAGDLPEVGSIIRTYSCGVILEQITVEKISAALKELTNDRIKLGIYRKNASKAAETLNWDAESEKVSRFYLQVLEENGYF